MTKAILEHVRFEGRRPRSRALSPGRAGSWPHAGTSARRCDDWELSEDERQLFEAIFATADLRLTDFRPTPLARRMHAVLRAVHCSTVRQAIVCVPNAPGLASRALNALVNGHTLAFRGTEVFTAMREEVLPQLGPAPRVWSAGCSRGLELLSVALLLELGNRPAAQLLGSDCRRIAPWNDSRLTGDFLGSIPSEWEGAGRIATEAWVQRQIRAAQWRQQNLLSVEPVAHWDLILCRNVSIYLQPESSARLWSILTRSLRPGGFLVTGKAERPPPSAGLKRVSHCIYRR
jgi:chemotaxis protein methyltransferase CheR